MNPPTVEGWHTGGEWIDSGTLVERINFAADQVGNLDLPGVQDMVARVSTDGGAISAEQVVNRCLELLGSYELADETHEQLVAHVGRGGDLVPRICRVLPAGGTDPPTDCFHPGVPVRLDNPGKRKSAPRV